MHKTEVEERRNEDIMENQIELQRKPVAAQAETNRIMEKVSGTSTEHRQEIRTEVPKIKAKDTIFQILRDYRIRGLHGRAPDRPATGITLLQRTERLFGRSGEEYHESASGE